MDIPNLRKTYVGNDTIIHDLTQCFSRRNRNKEGLAAVGVVHACVWSYFIEGFQVVPFSNFHLVPYSVDPFMRGYSLFVIGYLPHVEIVAIRNTEGKTDDAGTRREVAFDGVIIPIAPIYGSEVFVFKVVQYTVFDSGIMIYVFPLS